MKLYKFMQEGSEYEFPNAKVRMLWDTIYHLKYDSYVAEGLMADYHS